MTSTSIRPRFGVVPLVLILLAAGCSGADEADADIAGIGGTADVGAPTTPAPPTTVPSTDAGAPSTSAAPTSSIGASAPSTTDAVEASATSTGDTIQLRTADGLVDDVVGELSAPAEVDEFEFDAIAGRTFVIQQLGGCTFTGDDTIWLDVEGAGIDAISFFRQQDLEDSVDCLVVNRYDVDKSGPVRLTMRHPDGAVTGPYSFRVVDVTDEPVVPLSFGDVVGPGSPTPGSGIIEGAGRQDVFSIEVLEGQALVIEQLGDCLFDGDDSLWLDVNGPGLDAISFFEEQDLEESEDCLDVDRYEIEEDGTVFLRMRHSEHVATGTYNFRVVDETDDPAIRLSYGDVVGPDVPVAGAGRLDTVGENDVYTVEVSNGDVLVIEQLGGCVFDGDDSLWLDVNGVGLDSISFFDEQDLERSEDCLSVDRYEIEQDGLVFLRMRHSDNLATGTYNFRVGAGAETTEEATVILDELDAEDTGDGSKITLDETVLFDFGESELRVAAIASLAKVADVLGVYSDGDVLIVGHTDSIGSDADNDRLSEARADAVVAALVELGVSEDRLVSEGRGESEPVAPNENSDGSDNPDGRALNRRVEIFVQTG